MPAPDGAPRRGRRAGGYLLGQGGRVAILVQGASDPSKVVRLDPGREPQRHRRRERVRRADRGGRQPVKPHYIGGWRDYNAATCWRSARTTAGRPGRTSTRRRRCTTNYDVHSAKLDARGPRAQVRLQRVVDDRDAERVPGERRGCSATTASTSRRPERWRSGRSSTTPRCTIRSTCTRSTARSWRSSRRATRRTRTPKGELSVGAVRHRPRPAQAGGLDAGRRQPAAGEGRPEHGMPILGAGRQAGRAGQGRAAAALRGLPRRVRRALPPAAARGPGHDEPRPHDPQRPRLRRDLDGAGRRDGLGLSVERQPARRGRSFRSARRRSGDQHGGRRRRRRHVPGRGGRFRPGGHRRQ